MTLLLPQPGQPLVLANGDRVADADLYKCDSTSVLASNLKAVLLEHKYKQTFILPLESFDYKGVGENRERSAVLPNGMDLIKELDEHVQGKVRVDFMQKRDDDYDFNKGGHPWYAQLTFTRPQSAVLMKLMLA